MKKRYVLFLLVFLLSLIAVYGQGEVEDEEEIPWAIWDVVGYGGLLFAVLIFIMLQFGKKLKSHGKQFIYALVVLTVGFVSLYLIITTIFLNVSSVTGGPVHWHADYEVWVCGEELNLIDPAFPSNKIGTPAFHEHNENRIHVEGVVSEFPDVNLGAFFKIVGGELFENIIGFPTNEEYVHYENGMNCPSGNPGTLYVFVNGEEVDDFPEYVIEPYETVPPGDAIKIIFTDKPIEEIDPITKGTGGRKI